MTQTEKDAVEYRRLKGVMVLNYGPKGAMIKGLVSEYEPVASMTLKVIEYYSKKVKEEKERNKQTTMFP